jgi:dTDP-4-amino-4,6-dideoxygalactose transaminase
MNLNLKQMTEKRIYVTQPSLAPLDEYVELLKGVWERGILTHNGPLVQELERQLEKKTGTNNLSVVNNGTIALQIAIKALELKGEIITTPFTWVATLSAIKWEGCTPVFCDIDPETLNIDVNKIEASITEQTVAIMPVHVFGNACDVDAIEKLAKKHNLNVIYDAAHAIGAKKNGKSLLSYGDISASSLHATKLFNTAEGGLCIAKTKGLHEKVQRIRFFGHNLEKDIVEDGFNGKMTEVHAALGLANLKYYNEVLNDRKAKYNYYIQEFKGIDFIRFQKIVEDETNYSYFPIIFDTEERLLKVERKLNENNIYPRRYFYPSVNKLSKIVSYKTMPISEDIACRILCLPHYRDLDILKQDQIIDIIKSI